MIGCFSSTVGTAPLAARASSVHLLAGRAWWEYHHQPQQNAESNKQVHVLEISLNERKCEEKWYSSRSPHIVLFSLP